MPRFAAHLAEITALTFSPDSSLLVSADETGLLMFWNLKTWENIFVLNAHHGEMTELSFNVDGTQLRTSGLDGQIIVWEVSG
jgi:WD40 repeat protein